MMTWHVPPSWPEEPLSLREAVTLAEVSEDRLKKDIERGRFEPIRLSRNGATRLFVARMDVFPIAAAYRGDALNSRARRRIFGAWNKISAPTRGGDDDAIVSPHYRDGDRIEHGTISIDTFVNVDMKHVVETVAPRLATYASGLARIERRDDVLGGEPVFKESRLPVMHVGGMLHRGEAIDTVLEDYPYITENDAQFARLFFLAHPPVGRPRSTTGQPDVSLTPAG